jgi:uncharacterized protein with FMN-binding domain
MKKKYAVILIVLLAIAAAILAGTLIMKNINANLSGLSEMKIAVIDMSKLKNGTYEGSYKVFPVEAQVRVTVKDGAASDIKLIKHITGQGQAAESIPEKVVKAQSLDVDIVSGATYSSKVILKAIEIALKKEDISYIYNFFEITNELESIEK